MADSPDTPKDVAVKATGVINRLLSGQLELPKQLTDVIDMQGWARSLITRDDYHEPNPDYLSQLLLFQTLTAETQDDVFAQAGIRSLQKSIPNVPGGSTGAVEIYDLYVTDSDFGEGAKCYMILDTRDMDTGFEVKYTTGAQQLQAQILASICLGTWPLKCRITRTDRKDKGGRFMFWLFPPDSGETNA